MDNTTTTIWLRIIGAVLELSFFTVDTETFTPPIYMNLMDRHQIIVAWEYVSGVIAIIPPYDRDSYAFYTQLRTTVEEVLPLSFD